MNLQLRRATTDDIEEILNLHSLYQLQTISEEDKKDGFITTAFDKYQLKDLIEKEDGIFLAIKESSNTLVAYAMAASWQYWSQWPMFAHMITQLPKIQYKGYQLSVDNSYQYGPVAVDKSVRGTGVLEALFGFALGEMETRYPVLVTFINKNNLRSYAAHTRKLGLDVIAEFDYNDNHYYELACLTKPKS